MRKHKSKEGSKAFIKVRYFGEKIEQ